MAQQLAPEQLCLVLEQTLSPEADVRRNAERELHTQQQKPGHAVATLRIVAGDTPSKPAVRQAAAVHFKNIIKKGWDVSNEDGTDGITFSEQDRTIIKDHLVELMCTVPPAIQSQCSESISLIAKVDFPQHWQNLLPSLVHKFNSPDIAVVNGALLTTNSIFKPFRYVQRSDALYRDILYSLNIVAAPLLTKFKSTGQEVVALANNAAELQPRFAALRTMCRIFYSLNWQDLPEYFEDHMAEWMAEFSKYLKYENPLLTDADEELEPSPVDALQTAIIDNLYLYADKDEEPFMPFLPEFTMLVWNLLLKVTSLPKHDLLAVRGIKFLSMLVAKPMHKAMFSKAETLEEIISKIVIPNLMIREADEERFEDDPAEFIVRDIEGEDSESRRRNSQDLLRAMCRQFEQETTRICMGHITAMLAEYAVNPAGKWIAKDVAIHLFLGISIRAESVSMGVSQLNDDVNVMDFFNANIVPELQDTDVSARPIIKASSIKFVSTFRNQFSVEQLTALMPLLIAHLSSPSIVVHTYAALAIEKILTVTVDVAGAGPQLKFGAAQLRPFLEPLFTALFNVVDNAELNENQYAMKCIMRSLSVANEDVVPITQIILERITALLARVAPNPRNPQFNHYMFESIAVLIRSVCSKQPEATSAFEGLLFPPFQLVLQNDVSEFTPYVFQILAQILEYRPSGLGDAYTALYEPLLSPQLWQSKLNVPALVRLLKAYLNKAAPELVASGFLSPMLGIFQQLLSTGDPASMDLLTCLFLTVPADAMRPAVTQIFRLLCTRLQGSKAAMERNSNKVPRLVVAITNFFAVFCGKFGAQAFFDAFNAVQQGLWPGVVATFWYPRLERNMAIRMDAKIQLVGITRLLCDTPQLLEDAMRQELWSRMAAMAVNIIASSGSNFGDAIADDSVLDSEILFDSAFSSLCFARKPVEDPFPDIADPAMNFLQSLRTFSSANPGRVQPLLLQGLQDDPKLSAGLENMLNGAGIVLV